VYRHRRPPSVKELSEMLEISPEMGHRLCNRLHRLGVLEVVEGAFEERIYLQDHRKLEELPRQEEALSFEKELRQWRERSAKREEELRKLRADREAKKKDLFSDLERQLRQGLRKKKKNPLDDL